MKRRIVEPRMGVAAFVFCLVTAWSAGAVGLPSMHRGFNTFPWMFRAKTIDNDPQRFDFGNPFPYVNKFTPSDFAALHHAGVDLIRVPLEPGPFITADPTQRAALIATTLSAMRRVTDLGMTAIVDLHPHDGLKGWGAADILHSPQLLDGYQTALLELARAMANTGNTRLVLELMNEPPGGYGGSEGVYWIKTQPAWVKAIRQVAPTLPLIVTGDRGGSIDGLLRVDPSGFDDPQIIYTFHYYEPMIITHQGAGWGTSIMRRYAQNIAYPPVPDQEPANIDDFRDRLLIDTTLSDADRLRANRDGAAAIEDYFRRNQGPDRIRNDFSKVETWAKRYKIPPSRILLGEFGVFRPGASVDTVVHYANDVHTAAESFGYAWAYFNYCPFDETPQSFGVLQMKGPTPNAFDPSIMRGLGLTTR